MDRAGIEPAAGATRHTTRLPFEINCHRPPGHRPSFVLAATSHCGAGRHPPITCLMDRTGFEPAARSCTSALRARRLRWRPWHVVIPNEATELNRLQRAVRRRLARRCPAVKRTVELGSAGSQRARSSAACTRSRSGRGSYPAAPTALPWLRDRSGASVLIDRDGLAAVGARPHSGTGVDCRTGRIAERLGPVVSG